MEGIILIGGIVFGLLLMGVIPAINAIHNEKAQPNRYQQQWRYSEEYLKQYTTVESITPKKVHDLPQSNELMDIEEFSLPDASDEIEFTEVSMPDADSTKGIDDLLKSVDVTPVEFHNSTTEQVEELYPEEPPVDYFDDADNQIGPGDFDFEPETAPAAFQSPLEINHYQVISKVYGEKVAQSVTCTPEMAMPGKSIHIMIGRLKKREEGFFLLYGGAEVLLSGTVPSYPDEVLLIKGHFIDSNCFYCLDWEDPDNIQNEYADTFTSVAI